MHRNDKIVVGGIIATGVAITMNYVKVRRQEKQKQREITEELAKNLKALHVSYGRVMERLESGAYKGKGISTIMNDFQFEEIINRMED